MTCLPVWVCEWVLEHMYWLTCQNMQEIHSKLRPMATLSKIHSRSSIFIYRLSYSECCLNINNCVKSEDCNLYLAYWSISFFHLKKNVDINVSLCKLTFEREKNLFPPSCTSIYLTVLNAAFLCIRQKWKASKLCFKPNVRMKCWLLKATAFIGQDIQQLCA